MAQTPMGGGQMPPPPGGMFPGAVQEDSRSKGEIMMDTYGSGCGAESQRVANSIDDFKEMVNKIKHKEACEEVKNNLNNNIPKL